MSQKALNDTKQCLRRALESQSVDVDCKTPGVGPCIMRHVKGITKTPGKLRIMLVEDEAMLQRCLGWTFEHILDVSVATAGTLAEAVEILRRDHNFDVILLDLGLPDSEGIKTIERIRAADALTPIVVMSGTVFDREAVSRAGAQVILLKGVVGIDELLLTISSAVLAAYEGSHAR